MMPLTDPKQLDEGDGEVVLVRHVRAHALLVDAGQGEAGQRQQRRYGEAEVELQQTGQLGPGLHLQEFKSPSLSVSQRELKPSNSSSVFHFSAMQFKEQMF